MRVAYGSNKSDKRFLNPSVDRRERIGTNDIEVLLSKENSVLYFKDLLAIVERDWNCFSNVFEIEKNKLTVMMNDINDFGRPDAHAKEIKENDFQQLRIHFNKLEEITEGFL